MSKGVIGESGADKAFEKMDRFMEKQKQKRKKLEETTSDERRAIEHATILNPKSFDEMYPTFDGAWKMDLEKELIRIKGPISSFWSRIGLDIKEIKKLWEKKTHPKDAAKHLKKISMW